MDTFVSLVPYPSEIEFIDGEFILPEELLVGGNIEDQEMMDLSRIFNKYTKQVQLAKSTDSAVCLFHLDVERKGDLGKEGYELKVTNQKIHIAASTKAGLFYAGQTLRQLLSFADKNAGRPALRTQTITDLPQFEWRGSMLDISRRFMSVAYIKQHIDRMAAYKLNRLHLHLTDDQGWRIEIKNWPKLTNVGGKGACGKGKPGYLTQAEYLDLQQYARDKQIVIIPEVDLPGHIYAALVSYPEVLLCPDTSNINPKHVLPPQLYTGDKVGWSKLCLTDPESYRFVSEVLEELSAITLGDYIHMGGDEIEDERYTQFVSWTDSIIRANSKTMIGWEEVAKAEIDQSSIVQQWHGKIPLKKSQPTIYSLCQHLYLDHANYPGQERTNNWCKKDGVDLKDVYTMEIDSSQFTLGVEAPIWTEYIDEGDQVDGMLWPRLLAVSERAWSRERRDYEDFVIRVNRQIKILEEMKVIYYKHPVVFNN